MRPVKGILYMYVQQYSTQTHTQQHPQHRMPVSQADMEINYRASKLFCSSSGQVLKVNIPQSVLDTCHTLCCHSRVHFNCSLTYIRTLQRLTPNISPTYHQIRPPLHHTTPHYTSPHTPPHRHVSSDPQEVPITGSILALDEVVAQSIAEGEGVEHVLPVRPSKHKGPPMSQLPAHVGLVIREPGEGRGEGGRRREGRGREGGREGGEREGGEGEGGEGKGGGGVK